VIDEEATEDLVATPANDVGLVEGEKESRRQMPVVVEPECRLSLF
jgi:hypothetical protein